MTLGHSWAGRHRYLTEHLCSTCLAVLPGVQGREHMGVPVEHVSSRCHAQALWRHAKPQRKLQAGPRKPAPPPML